MTTTGHSTITPFEYALNLNVEGVRHSLQYMPDSRYKAYCTWVLNSPELAGRWLQLMGIESLIRLTGGLLNDLLSGEQWEQLIPYSVPINVSQMYEVVSDNLAIGLARRAPEDATYNTRAQLVYVFNQATIQRLKGYSQQSARELLDPFIPMMQKISTFAQSLSAEKHRALSSEFLKQHPDATLADLEYALHPLLVANMETCIELTQVLVNTPTYPLLVDGLIRRYQGVNDLLERSDFSFDELLAISTNTIMVVPTLAYYIGVIAEFVHPMRGYQQVLNDGSLLEALEDAALLVRLLNDMGTLLLEQSPAERRALLAWLHGLNQTQFYPTFERLMLEATGQQENLLTRMRKDVRFEEFNICLHPVRQVHDIDQAIGVFAEQLNDIAQVYRDRMQRLRGTVALLNHRLNNKLVGEVIMRFVEFHRRIYSLPFESAQGEYAV